MINNTLEIVIKKRGKPSVNAGTIHKRYKNMALVSVDMHSKYCVVDGLISGGIPAIVIGVDENSIQLTKLRSDCTLIEFPQFDGWTPLIANLSKYTLFICLTKKWPL